MTTNCNNSPIDVYIPFEENPWSEEKIRHLYRRLGYGATPGMIQDALLKTPSDLVDELIEEAINDVNLEDPGWGNWDYTKFEESFENQFGLDISFIEDGRRYLEYLFHDILRKKNLKSSLLFFWTDHFVVSDISTPNYLFQLFEKRYRNSIGNFKNFVYEIGLDNAMLFFLNGIDNEAGNPNENYARELYELFTLGVDNGYTESDIEETARALTGYNNIPSNWANIQFDANKFDNGEKTIFGQTGNWGYDDVIRILFEEKAEIIANYICTKFYKYYVSPDINQIIIDQLSQIFIENSFEIAPVLSSLFKSQHFFDEQCFGCIIKNPLELIISLQKELEMDYDDTLHPRKEYTRLYLLNLDMKIHSAPNVSGWPEDENWINSVTLAERWTQTIKNLENQLYIDSNIFLNFIKNLFDTNEDPNTIATGIVDFFLSKKLVNENEYNAAITEFKGDVPENYFYDGTWSLDYPDVDKQVYQLLTHICNIPEFQLK